MLQRWSSGGIHFPKAHERFRSDAAGSVWENKAQIVKDKFVLLVRLRLERELRRNYQFQGDKVFGFACRIKRHLELASIHPTWKVIAFPMKFKLRSIWESV